MIPSPKLPQSSPEDQSIELLKLSPEEAKKITETDYNIIELQYDSQNQERNRYYDDLEKKREYRLKFLVVGSVFTLFTLSIFISMISGFFGEKAKSIKEGADAATNHTIPIVTLIVGYWFGERKQKADEASKKEE